MLPSAADTRTKSGVLFYYFHSHDETYVHIPQISTLELRIILYYSICGADTHHYTLYLGPRPYHTSLLLLYLGSGHLGDLGGRGGDRGWGGRG